jgi:hypothetical protein
MRHFLGAFILSIAKRFGTGVDQGFSLDSLNGKKGKKKFLKGGTRYEKVSFCFCGFGHWSFWSCVAFFGST